MIDKQTKPASRQPHTPYSFTGYVFAWVKKAPQAIQTGIQLVELMIALAILAITVAVAIPSYTTFIDKERNAEAAADIISIAQAIERFYVRNNRYPNDLTEVGFNDFRDPWDNTYQYLRIFGAGLKGKGALRKDKKLNPVNSDFDLYSMGKDGQSKKPFTAKPSRDDIVRANNGQFIGLAVDY